MDETIITHHSIDNEDSVPDCHQEKNGIASEAIDSNKEEHETNEDTKQHATVTVTVPVPHEQANVISRINSQNEDAQKNANNNTDLEQKNEENDKMSKHYSNQDHGLQVLSDAINKQNNPDDASEDSGKSFNYDKGPHGHCYRMLEGILNNDSHDNHDESSIMEVINILGEDNDNEATDLNTEGSTMKLSGNDEQCDNKDIDDENENEELLIPKRKSSKKAPIFDSDEEDHKESHFTIETKHHWDHNPFAATDEEASEDAQNDSDMQIEQEATMDNDEDIETDSKESEDDSNIDKEEENDSNMEDEEVTDVDDYEDSDEDNEDNEHNEESEKSEEDTNNDKKNRFRRRDILRTAITNGVFNNTSRNAHDFRIFIGKSKHITPIIDDELKKWVPGTGIKVS